MPRNNARAIGASSLLLALALMWGAGCGVQVSECAFDADCGADRACALGTCRELCAMDDDCAELAARMPDDEIACRPFTRPGDEMEAVNLCAPAGFDEEPTVNNGECSTDAECVEVLGSEFARCSLIKTCIMPPPEYGILVRDVSEGEGAEILAMYVEDDSGEILGWAVTLDYLPADMPPSNEPVFDGTRRALDASRQCVSAPDEVRGIDLGGEGGALRVYFVDGEGVRLDLVSGYHINIIERGSNCDARESSDEYEVRLCVSRAGDMLMTPSQCEEMLEASNMGRARLMLSLPE